MSVHLCGCNDGSRAGSSLGWNRRQGNSPPLSFSLVVTDVADFSALAPLLQVAMAAILTEQVPRASLHSSFTTIAHPSAAVVAIRIVTQAQSRLLATWMRLSHVLSDWNGENTSAQFAVGLVADAAPPSFPFSFLVLVVTCFFVGFVR